MSSNVPEEVLEIILSYLMNDNDTASLKSCALVSTVFLQITRSFLFSHVFLLPQPLQPATALSPRSYSLASRSGSQLQSTPRSGSLAPYPSTEKEPSLHETNACLEFLRLLSMSPALARHVKRLSVIDGRLFPSADFSEFQDDTVFSALGLGSTQSPQYHATRDKLNGPPWFLSTPSRALSLLLQKLNLQSFDLVFQDGPKVSFNEIPEDIHSALNLAFTSPSLRNLELRGVSWDTPTSLRSLTNALSQQSSIAHLTLCNVRIFSTLPDTHPPHRGRSLTPRPSSPLHTHAPVDRREKKQPGTSLRQINNHSPHAKPFPGLNIPSQIQNHQNQHLMAPASDSNTKKASSCALRLESLCVTATSDSGHSFNALDTLDLLRVLFLSSNLGSQGSFAPQPLINPDRLKRLSIPTIDLDDLPEVLDTLTRSGVSTHLEELILNDRLGISVSGHPSPRTNVVPDFSGFTNLRYLRLGIHIYPNPITATPTQTLYTHSSIPHLVSPPPAVQSPSMLLWLTRTLDTVPPTLSHLSVNFSSDKQTLDVHRQENESDWRVLANSLRSRQSKYLRVSLTASLMNLRSGFGSGLVSCGSVPSAFARTGRGGRGRGRVQLRFPGSGFANVNVTGGEGYVDIDEKDVKTWFGDMFRGLDLNVGGVVL